LSRLQFVRFDTGRGVTRPLAELAEALRQDLDWIREHTRLGELARRWNGRGRPESQLLRGEDFDLAKAWVTSRKAAAPEITDGQRAFVMASEKVETARLAKERAQFEATARRRRRIVWLFCAVAVGAVGVVGDRTWRKYDLVRREINELTARAADALNEGQFDRAMRYALQAYPARGHLPWITLSSTELEGKLAAGAQSMRVHRLLKGHSDRVWSAAFSDDGKLVVTASSDKTARIWEVASGNQVAVLSHSARVRSATFSGDGKRVVTASDDGTARIWDVENGKEVATVRHAAEVMAAAFSGGGNQVVTASYDKTALIWTQRAEGSLFSTATPTA
jgi:hypothetical protein